MESNVDFPCPTCNTEGSLTMLTLSSEIAYFGEHTQITLSCDNCGMRVTDYIPSEERGALAFSLSIEKLEHLGNVQDNGWFFTSKSGKKIDGRYIFATESSASKNDLTFSIGDNTGNNIEIKNTEDGGGCLIATAAFGSEMAPQVQFLREIRDNTVLQTESGTSFMTGFNQFYYSFSPTIADYERENPAFKEAVKLTLTPLLSSLTLLQYADIDSESEMLGYGIGIILLNIGMYFVAPVVLIMNVRKRI